jgi:hypothetical protein
MKKILCHVGPWSLDQYSFVASLLDPSSVIIILSGHPKCDESTLFKYYLELIEKENSKCERDPPSADELDVVLRCRLLRALDRPKALKHLRAMRRAIQEVLDLEAPDLVLTETIDSYIMDLLHIESMKRKIRFIGLVPTFINGYFRITARGEYVPSRHVSNDETKRVLKQLLELNYQPNFLKNNNSRLWIYAIGRWMRNAVKIPYFLIKRIDRRERLNYHNWATLIVSMQWFHWLPTLSVGNNNWRALASQNRKKTIYIPLQMIPEATVDYWCENIDAVNYDEYLIKLIQHLNTDFTLLIKEHPNVLGYRNPALYRQLREIDSVVFAPTNTNSQELIDVSDAVLVWTGSVGFEAAIRGKAVLTTCDPYYVSGDYFKQISLNTPVQEITKYVDSFNINQPKQRSLDLIEHVLSGLLPGRYIIDGSWSAQNAKHVEYAKNIAAQLKSYLQFSSQP